MSDDAFPPPPPPKTPPPPPPAASTSVSSTAPNRSTAQNVSLVALVAAFAGSFLPWFTASAPFIGSLTANGTEGDGKVTAVLAGLGVALVLLGRNKNRNYWLGPMVLSLLVVLVAGYNVNDVIETDSTLGIEFAEFSVAYGLWLVLVASGVATVSCAASRRRKG